MNPSSIVVHIRDSVRLDRYLTGRLAHVSRNRIQRHTLHIHSYGASRDVKDTTMTPEAIVDSAAKQGLSVIAITDHNSNKNVERAIELYGHCSLDR